MDGAYLARVITLSSTVHQQGRIRFDDLQGEESYGPWTAYSQPKLANLLFAFELDRRARACRPPTFRPLGRSSADSVCWPAVGCPSCA
jgi:hypothetical protein